MEPDEPGAAENPGAPFAPEDSLYQALVSHYVGLKRAGADPFAAALITAAQLIFVSMATPAPDQHDQGEPEPPEA